MSFLAGTDDVSPVTEQFYAQDRDRLGYVMNATKVFAPRPAVFAAWQQLNGAIKAAMDPRHYELATVAAARELRSSYCTLAHGAVLARQLDEDTVLDLVTDPQSAALDPTDHAVVALATAVTRDATAVSDRDFDELRRLGFADPDILDVVLAAAARCFFSTVLDATGTQADRDCAGDLREVTRAALTVGRPVAG